MPETGYRRRGDQGTGRGNTRAEPGSPTPDTDTTVDSLSPEYADLDDPEAPFAGALGPAGPTPQPQESAIYEDDEPVYQGFHCARYVETTDELEPDADYSPQPTPTDPEVRSAPPICPAAALRSERRAHASGLEAYDR